MTRRVESTATVKLMAGGTDLCAQWNPAPAGPTITPTEVRGPRENDYPSRYFVCALDCWQGWHETSTCRGPATAVLSVGGDRSPAAAARMPRGNGMAKLPSSVRSCDREPEALRPTTPIASKSGGVIARRRGHCLTARAWPHTEPHATRRSTSTIQQNASIPADRSTKIRRR